MAGGGPSWPAQAAAASEHVDRAGAWCLRHFPRAAPGLRLRAAGPADGATLLEMEAIGFKPFARPQTPAERRPYLEANGAMQGFGYRVKAVACTDQGIGAYLMAQVRNWGEIYIAEVVARPVRPSQRIPDAGALLLGVVARLALSLQIDRVCAQVRRLDRDGPIAGYHSARIIAHDARHGLLPVDELGVLPDGRLSEIGDAWLQGRSDDILRRLLAKFGGPALEACVDDLPPTLKGSHG